MAAPYSWPWGSSINAKIIASNVYGNSLPSPSGNGGVIVTNPDLPINLADAPSITNSVQIGLTWAEGAANGGTPVLDYRIIFDQGINSYAILASGVQSASFTATGLTPGLTYKFKVGARNSFGYSAYTAEVSILAA